MGYIIGHLHPALVHLPIGFIILATLLEFYRTEKVKNIASFLWIASAVASILAMATGVALLRSGYFEGGNMFIHLLSGYAIALFTSVIAYSKWNNKLWFKRQHTVLKTLLVGLLFVSGHTGGELTHGVDHLPNPFNKTEVVNFDGLATKASINVYKDMIQPIFHIKCNRCHEPGDTRGKLDMTTKEGLLASAKGESTIVPGYSNESELFKRVTLNPSNRKFMPPSGAELEYKEIKLIEWWIENGASFDAYLNAQTLSKRDKKFFKYQFGITL